MSDKTLTAKIVATDGASPVFAKVAEGATKMGASVSAGGAKAAAGMKQAEEGGGRLKGVYENLKGSGASLGIVLSSVGELFGEVARASEEASASEERLKTAVEDTGAEWDTYSDKIEKALQTGHQLAFSHEEVEGALSNLVTVTKDTNTALQDLALAEDVARARGVSLETAALAIGRAQEGNAAALTRLGFVVDQTASSTEQLAQVQQQAAGQAQAFASTSAGSFDRVKDSIHNMLVEVGDHLGPMQTLLALLPGLSAGGTLVAGAFGELAEVFLRDEVAAEGMAVAEGEAAIATEALGAASAEAEVASAGLLAALGPIGLVAAAAAAAVAIYELTKGHHDESAAAKEAASATHDLAATLAELAASGSPLASIGSKWADDLSKGLGKIPDQLAAIRQQMTDISGTDQPTAIAPDDTKLQALESHYEALLKAEGETAQATEALNAIFRDTGTGARQAEDATSALFHQFEAGTIDVVALVDGILKINSELTVFDQRANVLTDVVNKWSDASKKVNDEVKLLGDYAHATADNLGQSSDAADKFAADLQTLADAGGESTATLDSIFKQLTDHKITLEQAEKEAAQYANSLREQTRIQEQAADAENRADRAVSDGIVAKMAAIQAQKQFNDSVYAGFQALGILASMDKDWATNTDAVTGAIKRTHDALGQMTPMEEAARADFARNAAMLADWGAHFKQVTGDIETAAHAVGLFDTAAKQMQAVNFGNIPGAGSATNQIFDIVAGLQAVGSALGGDFKAIVGGTNDIASQIAQVAKWGDELIGIPGAYGKIDDALAKGLITQGQYNRAQTAQIQLDHDAAKAQDLVNAMQAEQAPLLADLANKQLKYLEALEKQPAASQLAAEGWMDQAEAAKAMQLESLAATAAQEQVGVGARKAAAETIQAAAEADPVLEQMLEKIGLITVDKQGNIKVNLEGGKEAQSALDKLDDTLKGLITALWEVFIKGDASGAKQAATEADGALRGTTDHQWTATIGGDASGATQAASDADSALSGLTSQDWTVGIGADATNFYGVVNGILGTTLGQAFIEIDAVSGTGGAAGQAAIKAALGGGRLGGVADHLVVPSYARGGVVAQLAEIGPEMVTAPGGHRFMAWDHGVYSVPSGSYVNDAASTASKMGSMGGGIVQNFYGDVHGFAGMDDLMAAAARSARAHLAGLGL